MGLPPSERHTLADGKQRSLLICTGALADRCRACGFATFADAPICSASVAEQKLPAIARAAAAFRPLVDWKPDHDRPA